MNTDKVPDIYARYLSTQLYGAPPSREVLVSEDWDYLITNDPEWPHRYHRHGDGVRLLKKGVNLTRTEYEWVPDEKAIRELKALMRKWRARGLAAYVSSVEVQQGEDGGTFSVYDSLGHSKSKRISKTFSLYAVKFYKELPHDPVEGLKRLVSEPRRNARVTGLSATGLP